MALSQIFPTRLVPVQTHLEAEADLAVTEEVEEEDEEVSTLSLAVWVYTLGRGGWEDELEWAG